MGLSFQLHIGDDLQRLAHGSASRFLPIETVKASQEMDSNTPTSSRDIGQDESIHCSVSRHDSIQITTTNAACPNEQPEAFTDIDHGDPAEHNPSEDNPSEDSPVDHTGEPEADNISGDESTGEIFNDINSHGSLNQRRKKASRRILQTIAYARLMEERMSEAEKRIQDILRLPHLYETSDEPSDAMPQLKVEIAELCWATFTKRVEIDHKSGSWNHRPEIDLSTKSVIEILTEEPHYEVTYHRPRQLSRNDPKNVLRPFIRRPLPFSKSASSQDNDGILHQVRIRSKVLLNLLQNITGFRTVKGPHRHRLLMLRPFKLLIAHRDQLQERLCMLESRWQKVIESNLTKVAISTQVNSDHFVKKKSERSQEMDPSKDIQSLEALDHLRILCEVIKRHLEPQIRLYGHVDTTLKSSNVAFHDLWCLFRPGSEVRASAGPGIQLYRVLKVTGGREILSTLDEGPPISAWEKLRREDYSEGSFIIECFYYDFDGSHFGPVNETFQIRKFEGNRDVKSLPVYPLIYDPEGDACRNTLLNRGQKFAALCSPGGSAHRKYKGLTLDSAQEQVESEIIIDFQLAFINLKNNKPRFGIDNLAGDDTRELSTQLAEGPCDLAGCCGNDISFDDYEVDNKVNAAFKDSNENLFKLFDDPKELSDSHKAILPTKVYGFILRTRKWASFDINLIQPQEYGKGWDDLVIDPDKKRTVLALVDNHDRPDKNPGSRADGVLPSVDLVQGKGRGLIILLHGEPGVGKTSTAECVAAHTQRPLYPITCGDIGDSPDTVEDNLEKNFQLAHKWGCVLLLDEADIFLSKRNENDIQRNAIVSVFLRSLEYYSGILFLTTNRVGQIDRAFKSRIHLSLYYPRLNKERTVQIWETNLKRVKDEFLRENRVIECRDEEIKAFAKEHFRVLKKKEGMIVWNGRQIRNAFQTAIAIATHECIKNSKEMGKDRDVPTNPVLTRRHFEQVAHSAEQFERYLYQLAKCQTEADLARSHYLRDDSFSELSSDAREEELEEARKAARGRRDKKKRQYPEASEDTDSDEENSDYESKSKSKKRRKQ